MELNLQRQTITVNEVVYNATVEQPIECDALLPDYCPDIVKVLKCAVSTSISSTQVSGEHLTIEGMATAHVYYTADTGGVRRAEYKIPFARNVDLKASLQSPIVTVVPSVDYVNCRAVNQRRIDIRGAISLAVKVCDRKEEQVISDAEGGGIQLRRDMINATEFLGQCENEFDIREDLEIGYGKSPVNTIVRSDCRVNVHDHKIVSGKVVAKGDFMLHVLYQPAGDTFNLEVMEYTLPISQIIDCDGIDEDCTCDVEMFVQSCDVQPKADESGEYCILALDAHIMAVVASHCDKEVPVACDCYSTLYDCKSTQHPVLFMRLVDIVREVIMHKTTLELPEGLEEVLDAWCEVDSLKWERKDKELQLSLRLTVSMFAKMEEGECQYFEQSTELEQNIPLKTDCDKIMFDPTCDVLSSAYNLLGKEKIDIRCEVVVKGCVYCTIQTGAIGDIMVDENTAREKPQNKLYIYYADAGESIWNIAKRYNTSSEAIWAENSIEHDTLSEKTMLLIPICG